ncbi:MAG: alpha-ketoglutarate-dependent 2,4-dichlorophenoxyacetate dioxygenase [Gammaproteobacteria bacterium]|jgi:alpha-ketoglutarate-dependent 2,4-dichlorophenoxyacetate dioxygenase
MKITKLHSRFAACIQDIDLSVALTPDVISDLSDALDRHSVLVFPQQDLTPEAQVQFSSSFGPLEQAITRMGDDEASRQIALLSNVSEDGSLVPMSDKRMLFHRGNEMWHTDSTYKPQTALASLLYAVEVPPTGGQTEFASTRAAYADLGAQDKQRVDNRFATHSLAYSRAKVAKGLMSEALQKTLPPVERPLVRVNPSTGERSLYVASHAFAVRGMDETAGLALIEELLSLCTQEKYIYRHQWQAGDLLMWDNRSTLHRATSFDGASHRRIMRRSTVIDAQYMASLQDKAT